MYVYPTHRSHRGIPIGAELVAPGLPAHYGILAENGTVIHAQKGVGVQRTLFPQFTPENRVVVSRVPQSPAHRDDILRKAYRLIGKKPYHALHANCEHLTTYAYGDVPHSRQVGILTVGAFLLLTWYLSDQ
jgi:hypothetical protein